MKTKTKTIIRHKDYSKDNRISQEIFLDIMAEAEAKQEGITARILILFDAGFLPRDLIINLLAKGTNIEIKRLREHPAIAERARALNPNYDNLVKQREEKIKEAINERNAKPLTAKEKEQKAKSDKVIEAGRKTWEEISAAMNFYQNFKLSDGTKLVDATKAKLLQETESEKSKSTVHKKNATFYKAICDKMPANPNVTVGEALTAKDVGQIREKVFV